MKALRALRDFVEDLVIEHERAITALLLAVAVVLVLVALFGRPHHKVAAMLYIVL